MIVFLNQENNTITICDKDVKVIPLTRKDLIKKELQGKRVMYITEIVETDGDSVFESILDMSDDNNEYGDHVYIPNSVLYLRKKEKGNYFIKYQNRNLYLMDLLILN